MNNALFDAEIKYAREFEDARAAFHPAKNDSKSDSYKAYRQTEKQRTLAGAIGSTFIRCCELYNSWLSAENTKRRQQRQSECPRAHMATFLRQKRWENFIEEAKQASEPKQLINIEGWEAEAAKIRREISEEKFAAWFSDVQVKRGQPIELIFPSIFKAKYVAGNFRFAICRAFGDCRLSAPGSPEKLDI